MTTESKQMKDTRFELQGAQDAMFEEEQAHLKQIYSDLLRLGRVVVEKMEKTADQAQQDKRAMAEELSVNLANYADAMETYADFAAMNRIVDVSNVVQANDAQRLSDITLLLQQPYFAKVVLKFPQFEEAKEIYIGAVGMSDENYKKLVVDWRSPVAEVYYNQGTGHTSYEANGRTIHTDLQLRRQFDIHEDKLLACFDTTVAIQDPLLLAALSQSRSDSMRAITTTIQKEQNAVIRHEDVPVLLVVGAAGSGKTSVMMQRIAYLFYQHRDDLRPEDVVIITPNPVFQRYVSSVLPSLGEENPRIAPWSAILGGLLPEERGEGKRDVPVECLQAIDRAVEEFDFEPGDFCDITCEGVRMVGASAIMKLSTKHNNIAAGPHRIALIQEGIMKRLETRLTQIAAREDTLEEMAGLSLDDQIASFGSPFDLLTEEELRDHSRRFVRKRFAAAFEMVEDYSWVDIDRLGARLLERHGLTTPEWLYLKMCVSGLSDHEARYVMIDEVQDYTAVQLMVMARYFRRAYFLLLGDPNQAIEAGTVTFDQLRDIFNGVRAAGQEELCRMFLPTSYRCTPQITDLFAGLAQDDLGMTISSVQREGSDPIMMECPSEEAYEQELLCAFARLSDREGIAAIIANDGDEAQTLQERLTTLVGQSGEEAACPMLMTAHEELPSGGVVVIPLALAKGLEFDSVVIADASAEAFPGDPRSQRRLYTAISRATRELTILSKGSLAPLLGDIR